MSTSSPTAVNSQPRVRHRQAHDRMSEPGMGKKRLWALLAVIVSCVIPHGLAAETLKIASPIRGSWEGAIPELGKQAGIFRKYDLDLDILSTRAARMIARASDIAAIREQTIRVQITSASNLAAKKDVIARYMKAYNETVDWMYSSPDAVPRYLAFSGLAEPAVRLMLREFIPRESLQTEKIMGLGESMKDAVQFKFLSTPLSDVQLKELIQVPA